VKYLRPARETCRPLAAALFRRQVHRENQLQGRRKEHADNHRLLMKIGGHTW
jgi:hypothetical protein